MVPIEWAADFQHWKFFVIQRTGLEKDALHIYAGLAMFMIVRLAWRWRYGGQAAWLAAVVLALGTEYPCPS